ncbi:MAG: glycosyltransferase [Elusimicrobia bacterium]|nr:glycosyltransferase [Elusimicrobiota bacterium]
MRPRLEIAKSHIADGHDARMFLIANQTGQLHKDGVRLCSYMPDEPIRTLSKFWVGGCWPGRLQFAMTSQPLMKALADFSPNVVHFHSFSFPGALKQLTQRFKVIVQDHGGLPPRGGWISAFFQEGLSRTKGVIAMNNLRLELWRNYFGPDAPRYLTVESPSYFLPGNREQARLETGIQGQPSFLWSGHLDENKDPVTILKGFHGMQKIESQATLYFAYQRDGLLRKLKSLSHELNLEKKIYFLGHVNHPMMEKFFRSCDFFVLGTNPDPKRPETWEVGGRSLAEALSCGAIPLVADNPSFRWMTDGGRYALLFKPGDAQSMFQTYRQWKQKNQPIEEFRREIASFSQHHRSAQKTAQDLIAFYENLN